MRGKRRCGAAPSHASLLKNYGAPDAQTPSFLCVLKNFSAPDAAGRRTSGGSLPGPLLRRAWRDILYLFTVMHLGPRAAYTP